MEFFFDCMGTFYAPFEPCADSLLILKEERKFLITGICP